MSDIPEGFTGNLFNDLLRVGLEQEKAKVHPFIADFYDADMTWQDVAEALKIAYVDMKRKTNDPYWQGRADAMRVLLVICAEKKLDQSFNALTFLSSQGNFRSRVSEETKWLEGKS